jgi:rhodanese-related sulfurtransferase
LIGLRQCARFNKGESDPAPERAALAPWPGPARTTKNTLQSTMKKLLSLIVTTAFLASLAFAGEYPDISIKELKAAIEAGKVTVIDVNGSKSYKERGHVPGALDFAAIQGDLASKLPKDKNALIVAYCGGPTCKAYQKAATAAEKLGYKNVKHMSAGISGWLAAGEKVEKAN